MRFCYGLLLYLYYFNCYFYFNHCSNSKLNCLAVIQNIKVVAVFFIWKSLWVLPKACIKIEASAIYTYLFFLNYALSSCWKIKSFCDCCFPQQIQRQNTVQSYILQDYSSVRIGFNMINKCHTLLIVYTMFIKIS